MANEEQLSILKQGAEVWNKWREENRLAFIDLREADLAHENLSEANLAGVDLRKAYLFESNLANANLSHAVFDEASLSNANFGKAYLFRTSFFRAFLSSADFQEANLEEAELVYANLTDANFGRANLHKADLNGANLSWANFRGAKLNKANFSGANLQNADLRQVDLTEAVLVRTLIDGARISESSVYGISVWDLEGEFEEQTDLAINPSFAPIITVDNIKIAQFIYLILNNEEIRDVINTLTSKSVLILGRFAIPERKVILDALRDKLREYNLLPIVFDFDRPTDKDFTETIKTLAGISYFVIADVTNPKSSPLELQATVPDYQIPFVPIIQEGENSFAMMVDLQKKYNWVLNTVSYDSQETLMKVLKPLIIDPAMKKRQELRIIKAQEPEIISAKDYLAKGKK